MSDDASSECMPSFLGKHDKYHSLRIAAIFIIMVSSGLGSLFPLLAKRTLKLPGGIYDFAKYFGSGVIIATAFIHLLSPGFAELGSPCLSAIWQVYPWPAAISMASVFFIFFIELFAFRWGTARLKRLSLSSTYDPHGHMHGAEGTHAAHGPEAGSDNKAPIPSQTHNDAESSIASTTDHDKHGTALESHPLGQVLSVIILEFGVIFHSFIVGLTLAVSTDFIPLLCVLVFHQLFEGLGLGTRLAYLTIFTDGSRYTGPRSVARDAEAEAAGDIETANLKSKPTIPRRYARFPWFGAIAFALTTPLGIAIGLGVQQSYSPDSNTANIVSGVFDSFSSGILMYTGLVELLAHEFLFSRTMMEKGTGEVAYAGGCVLLGAGLMALLGRWA